MNERYTTDNHKGATRKSAASAKPVTKAASSVRIQPTEKTPQQKKAERKQQRAKQQERDRQFYNPPTAEYKRLRKIWWVCPYRGHRATCLSFDRQQLRYAGRGNATSRWRLLTLPSIAALYIDFAEVPQGAPEVRRRGAQPPQ